MTSILEQLFNGSYYEYLTQPPAAPGYRQAAAAAEEAWDKVTAALGEQEQTAIWRAVLDEGYYEQYADFRRGFRLGALLMLELMDRP
mgnify:CR=1 FL=1